MDDKKSQPTLIVIILMLLGLSAVPKGTTPENTSSKAAVIKSGESDESASEPSASLDATKKSVSPDVAVLAPLIDLSDDGSLRRIEERGDCPKFDADGRKKLVRELVDRAHGRGGAIEAMIALVPDPQRTSVSQDYDSQMDGLQRAAEAAGFVLARFRFPWQEARKPAASRRDDRQDDESDSTPVDGTLASKGTTAVNQSSIDPRTVRLAGLDDQPGLLVFRHGSEKILLVFLVRETPTFGLKKHQLNWSLHLLDAFADAQEARTTRAVNPRLICILGPRFTGTQTSLNQVIDGWLTRRPSDRLPGDCRIPPLFRRSYQFSIAASATEIDVDRLKKLRSVESLARTPRWIPLDIVHAAVPARPQAITYRSGSNRRNDITKVLIQFLNQQSGSRKKKIALLVESNTALGRTISQSAISSSFDDSPQKKKGRNDRSVAKGQRAQNDDCARQERPTDIDDTYINVYHYPLHIGSLRASYEKQGLLRDPAGQLFRSAGRLELPPEEIGRRRDIVSAETPDFSTRVDELVMVQTMTDIARGISQGRYDAVGVAGSSSRDVVFLAQLVRKYSPDALLFSSMADLLYTQPQTIADLRGMLVGSTYPLYAPNRLWSYPYGAGPDVYFEDDGFQAIYNAAMSLFSEIYREQDNDEIKSLAFPLELGLPFEREQTAPRPPIWISVVGNRGLYPIRVVAAGLDDSQFDPWPKPPGVMDKQGKPVVGSEVREFLFQPSYHPFWKVLEGLLLLLGLVLYGLAVLELWWVLAKIYRMDLARWKVWRLLARPASFFVWSRGWNSPRPEHDAGVPRSSSGHGPGFWLVLAHLAFFLVFLSTNWPFVVPAPWASGLYPEDWRWHLLAMVGFGVALASLLISVVSWLLLAFHERSIATITLTIAAVLGSALFACSSLGRLGHDSGLANFLTLERTVTVTSGVSPTMPMIFVGLGAACFLVAQLKRVYLSEQFSIKVLAPERVHQGERPVTSIDPLTNVEEKIDELAGVFRHPQRVLRLGDLAPLLLLALYIVMILFLWASQSNSGSLGEGPIFNTIFWSLFAFLAVVLAFHVCLVHVIWSHMKQLLACVSRLPLARSFDRMPPRVERWFYESPTPQNRSMMIERQATALAERSGPSRVRALLENACPYEIRSADWASLPEKLRRLHDPRPTELRRRTWTEVNPWLPHILKFLKDTRGVLAIRAGRHASAVAQEVVAFERLVDLASHVQPADSDANEFLKRILLRFWEGLPLTWTFATTSPADRAAEKTTASWPISPRTLQTLTGSAGVLHDDLLAGVREWTEIAEDLIALQLLRHLSQFVAQLRVMVTFIVLGSFSLLLAINSYPFLMQNRTEFALSILIAVAAATILRLIVGINRDETISRVANAASGLKLDRNLLTALIGYILPLVGILAAVSYDVSDLLRVWLEPVFRLFM